MNRLMTAFSAGAAILAGGVALNCVANGKILRDGAFEMIHWLEARAPVIVTAVGGVSGIITAALGFSGKT